MSDALGKDYIYCDKTHKSCGNILRYRYDFCGASGSTEATNLIAQRGTVINHAVAYTAQRLYVLLLNRLYRHWMYPWWLFRFTNGYGIIRIAFLVTDKRFDMLCRCQHPCLACSIHEVENSDNEN